MTLEIKVMLLEEKYWIWSYEKPKVKPQVGEIEMW